MAGGLKRHRGSASYSRPDPTPYQPVECPFETHFCVILHHFPPFLCVSFFFFHREKGETYSSINLSKYFNMLVFLLNSYTVSCFVFFPPSFPNFSEMKRQGISLSPSYLLTTKEAMYLSSLSTVS